MLIVRGCVLSIDGLYNLVVVLISTVSREDKPGFKILWCHELRIDCFTPIPVHLKNKIWTRYSGDTYRTVVLFKTSNALEAFFELVYSMCMYDKLDLGVAEF